MLTTLAVLAAALAAQPQPLNPPPPVPQGSPAFRAEEQSTVDLDRWPAGAARAADEAIRSLGLPHYFDDDKLLWNGKDGTLRTEIRREGLPVLQVVEGAPPSEEQPGVRYDAGRKETEFTGKSLGEVRAKRGLTPARP